MNIQNKEEQEKGFVKKKKKKMCLPSMPMIFFFYYLLDHSSPGFLDGEPISRANPAHPSAFRARLAMPQKVNFSVRMENRRKPRFRCYKRAMEKRIVYVNFSIRMENRRKPMFRCYKRAMEKRIVCMCMQFPSFFPCARDFYVRQSPEAKNLSSKWNPGVAKRAA